MVRRVTLRSIAARIGCSKNTVSLALRGNREIPARTRDRIRLVAEELGYRPDAVFSQLMAQLRLGQSPRFQAKLALANGHWDRDALRTHPAIARHVRGCEQRATRLGYSFDNFWLRDPELTAPRWIRILSARGIKGIVVVGMTDQNQLPEHLRPMWDHFPSVVSGVRTRGPALSFSCVDHYELTLVAVEKALELGYERPALVIADLADRLVERRFSTAMITAQGGLAARNRVPTISAGDPGAMDPAAFRLWYHRHKPDVILTVGGDVLRCLEDLDISVPRDVGVIDLEWSDTEPGLAGMNQHHEAVGEAAVDLLVEQLHSNSATAPAFPRATLIGATWMGGPSVARRRSLATPHLLAG